MVELAWIEAHLGKVRVKCKRCSKILIDCKVLKIHGKTVYKQTPAIPAAEHKQEEQPEDAGNRVTDETRGPGQKDQQK